MRWKIQRKTDLTNDRWEWGESLLQIAVLAQSQPCTGTAWLHVLLCLQCRVGGYWNNTWDKRLFSALPHATPSLAYGVIWICCQLLISPFRLSGPGARLGNGVLCPATTNPCPFLGPILSLPRNILSPTPECPFAMLSHPVCCPQRNPIHVSWCNFEIWCWQDVLVLALIFVQRCFTARLWYLRAGASVLGSRLLQSSGWMSNKIIQFDYCTYQRNQFGKVLPV